MGFKQSGFPMHKGTNSHSSALKMQQEQDAVAKLRAEQLKNAHSNPTRTNLDPYAENQPSPGKMMESGTAEPGSSPNKIWPLVPAAIARLGLAGLGRMGGAAVGRTLLSRVGGFLKHPITTLTGGYMYGESKGYKQGSKDEKKRLEKIGAAGAGAGAGGGDWLDKTAKWIGIEDKKTKKQKAVDTRKYTQAKSRNPQLDALINQRRGFVKGTKQYNAIQNQINIAYGDPTRHGQTKSMSTKRRKTTRTIDTPGVSTKVITGKKRISGKLKKRVTDIDRVEGMGRDRRIVEKFRKSGARKKTVEKYDTGQAIAGGQLGKKKVKTKYDKQGNVKKTVTIEGGKRIVTKGGKTKIKKTLNPFD